MSIPPVVYVVDDDLRVRVQIASMLKEQGATVHSYGCGSSFLAAPNLQAGLVLLDLHMPQVSGLKVLQVLSLRDGDLPCVMMSGAVDIELAVKAMKLGACDLLEKPFTPEDLIQAITSAWAGAEPRITDSRSSKTDKVAQLTARERAVLEALMSGYVNKDIAEHLDLSIRTVEMHRARMMKRLDAATIAEAVQMALQSGLQPLGKQRLAA